MVETKTSNGTVATCSLSKMVKKLTKDISDAAIPMQLCCSPHYVEKGTRAPTDSVIPTRRKCILIGHRGALAIEKENTIRGYHAAIDIGCDMLEFDVTATADGEEIACLHDYYIFNTGEWVRDLDMKTFKQKFPDTPFLEDILQNEKIVKSVIDMYLDIKQPGVIPILILMLSKAIREWGWSADRLFIASHVATTLLEFTVLRRGFPELNPIRLIAIVGCVPIKLAEDYGELGCYAVSLCVGCLSQEFIDDAHRRGMFVYMYTVNTLPFARDMIKRGADGLCSDAPHVIAEAVQTHNLQIISDGVHILRSQPVVCASSSLLNSLYSNADKARITETFVRAQKLLQELKMRGEDGNGTDENDIRNLRAIMSALEPYVAAQS